MDTRLSSGESDTLYRAATAFFDALDGSHEAEQALITVEKALRETMKAFEIQVITLPESDQVIVAEAADNWSSKVRVYGDFVVAEPLL